MPRLLSCSSSAPQLKSIFLLEDKLKYDLPLPLFLAFLSTRLRDISVYHASSFPFKVPPPSQLCRPAVNLARQLQNHWMCIKFSVLRSHLPINSKPQGNLLPLPFPPSCSTPLSAARIQSLSVCPVRLLLLCCVIVWNDRFQWRHFSPSPCISPPPSVTLLNQAKMPRWLFRNSRYARQFQLLRFCPFEN